MTPAPMDSFDDKNLPLYIMKVASDLAGVHPQTLRMYERLGLVKPQRTPRGQRQYSNRDIDTVREIRKLTQDMGVNLAGVRIVIAQRERITELEKKIATLEREVVDIDGGVKTIDARGGRQPR